MFIKWREMSRDVSGEHTQVKYRGNNQQSKIPGEAGGREIKQKGQSRRLPLCLILEEWKMGEDAEKYSREGSLTHNGKVCLRYL